VPALRSRSGADDPDHRTECRERHARMDAAAAPALALRAEFVGARVLLHDSGAAFRRRGRRPHLETTQRDRSRGGKDQRSLGRHRRLPGVTPCRRVSTAPKAKKSHSLNVQHDGEVPLNAL
jgi:hypothetical protein